MNRKLTYTGCVATLIGTLWTSELLGQSFSVDVGAVPPADDILSLGPAVVFAGAGAGVEVDAFSYHGGIFAPDGVNFSVAPGSAGAAGSAVATQVGIAVGEQVLTYPHHEKDKDGLRVNSRCPDFAKLAPLSLPCY